MNEPTTDHDAVADVLTAETEETPEEKVEKLLAFHVVLAAIKKATGGRKTRVADLTGPERRRARRILERRERRLQGVVPVGRIAPAMCHRTRRSNG